MGKSNLCFDFHMDFPYSKFIINQIIWGDIKYPDNDGMGIWKLVYFL